MEKAAQRIARYGFDTTTVRQIADDAEILSGSLYHHFSTKDEILHEIVRQPVRDLRDKIARIGGSDSDAETKLIAMVLLELREFVDNHRVHMILYNERRLFRQEGLFADILKAKRDMYRVWMKVIEEGISERKFNPALEPYHTIRTILRMLNSAADWYARDDNSIDEIRKNYTFEQIEELQLMFILGAVRDPHRAADPVLKDKAISLAFID